MPKDLSTIASLRAVDAWIDAINATPLATAGSLNIGTEFDVTAGRSGTNTLLTKSLEASNASMTQSVPELSLAQKLFSALTKILQVSQTNTDAAINLVR